MSTPSSKPPAHPGAAVLVIAGMSLIVAVALQVMGLSGRLDAFFTVWFAGMGLSGEFRDAPAPLVWCWTVPMVFGLAMAMLWSRRQWRRAVLWTTTLLLTLAWIPIFALAGFRAPAAMPLLALVWCGLWTMIYAARHQEPDQGED